MGRGKGEIPALLSWGRRRHSQRVSSSERQSALPPREQKALFTTILASVSRSFYLTIKVLPEEVRQPVGLAYLLARASDTMADSGALPAAGRLAALQAFLEAIKTGESAAIVERLPGIAAGTPDPAEQRLLSHTAALIALLHGSDPRERREIQRVLEVIISGQVLDVERFGNGQGGSLREAGELEDYTYRVAGCVGEFWTRVCFYRIRAYSLLSPAALEALGISFGKGLQLVNILRDAPEDLRQGRCYLPYPAPERLAAHPEEGRALYARWLQRAQEEMDAGRRYIEAIRPWRVRLACFLPWAIGVRTLRLLAKTPAFEAGKRVKIPRSEVRRLFIRGFLVAFGGNRFLGTP